MKSKITSAIFICILSMSSILAQQSFTPSEGGEGIIQRNSEPCVSDQKRAEIFQQIDNNIDRLKQEGRFIAPNRQGNHPLFIWPVEQADGFEYNSIWAQTNFVDHNEAFPDQIEDYNCGTRSYDTTSGYNHQGYDIITWPFWWKQMDLDQGINIAAADGQIIAKQDGGFDRNCSFNSDPLNGIAIQHSDGSRSFYYHFKNGGITSKGVGDTVVAGEYLGVIGSSGSSTLPHLHFEVYDSAGNLIDPSIGACNPLNSDTWWEDPKPYFTTGINAALTHTAPPQFNTCPETETTNESNQFDLGETVHYAIYLKDQRVNTTAFLKITRPDNTIQFEWEYDLVDNFNISYWIWNFPNDMEGEWIWEATYNGETATHTFNVGTLGLGDELLTETQLFPNPVSKELNIVSEEPIHKVAIHDISGREILNQESTNDGIQKILFPEAPNGIYFVTLQTESGASKTIKIIKD